MLVPKTDFIGLENVVHLAAGGETPLLQQHIAAVARFAADKATGMLGRDRFDETRGRVRMHLARMLGMQPADFALLGSASEGIAQVLSAIDWQPGDIVVTAENEFQSGLYALARLRALGVELRTVATPGHYLSADDLIGACDHRTRLVYLSHVSFRTGQRLDLERIAAGVHGAGAQLLVDATHSLGVVPVPGEVCDFVVCSGYKWLLASHMGILGWNRRRQPTFEPRGVGWRSGSDSADPTAIYQLHADATRAELGNPNYLDVYILESALEYLAGVGQERISAYVLQLSGDLRAALARQGLPITTPVALDERAGNICFLHPHAEELARLAAERGIQIWGGDGRVRVSVHLYVTPEDVAVFVAALPQLLAEVAERHPSDHYRFSASKR
jgi:cysteine desulfurase / selenocysteine lyase